MRKMPKDTFYNLPDEKRQIIEEAAIDEFSSFGFDNASINRIVAQCQIAKGSFYQYFEDKRDLFLHLMAQIAEEKIKFISPVMQDPIQLDFFTLLEEMYRSGLAYAKANPKSALIGNQVFKDAKHPVHSEVFKGGKDSGSDFCEDLLELAIARGEVRPDIDKKFVANMLIAISIAAFEYYFEVVKGDDFNIVQLDNDIMETINLSIDFIRNGIGSRVASGGT